MRRIDPAGVSVAPLWQAPDASLPLAAAKAAEDMRRDQELAAARERGQQDGYAQGLKLAQERVARENETWRAAQEQALEQSRRQADEARRRFEDLAAGVSAELQRLERQVEETAVSVTYAAVAKCLGDGYADGNAVRALVRSAISQAGHQVESIRVAQGDAELVGKVDSIAVVADPRLSPGQCILETRFGHYESGLDVRLESLKRALLSGLSRHRGAER